MKVSHTCTSLIFFYDPIFQYLAYRIYNTVVSRLQSCRARQLYCLSKKSNFIADDKIKQKTLLMYVFKSIYMYFSSNFIAIFLLE